MVSSALNVVLRPLLFAVNVVSQSACLRFEAFLFAVHYTYAQLHRIIENLYSASEKALEKNDLEDASLLESRADRLYQETENLEFVISELEDG